VAVSGPGKLSVKERQLERRNCLPSTHRFMALLGRGVRRARNGHARERGA